MIGLLARLAVAQQADGPGHGAEGERTLRLLEWGRVTDQIARRCRNARAAAAVAARRPDAAAGAIELRRALSDELRPLVASGRRLPLADISPACALLERDPPLRLESLDLLVVADAVEAIVELREFLLHVRAELPHWGTAAGELPPCGDAAAAIRRAVDRNGRVRDDATPTLLRLRRACARCEREVRAAVETVLVEARARGWTTGREATLRGDRFCLPLRAGDARRVHGIVHDRSGTGETLFVEPAEVVQRHNELTELRLESTAEEQRILLELNRRVEAAAPALREGAALLLLADEVCAALDWSKAVSGTRPHLVTGGPLRLVQARHPLLIEQEGLPQLVPLDLELPADRRAVIISGPNAGGKSVALKTAGLCCLLAQCGWDVPAREDSRFPLFARILVDLGDEQSIQQSLSSFAAHVAHLARFLEVADAETLVLCDEIGSGTDPQEGTALAFAVLEQLAERGATVLASTHFGLLKAAVAEHELMLNAAMEFDDETLQPLFSLRLGVPGSSHAFDIAARWGFSADLLARARARVGSERVEIESLLADLQIRTRELAAAQERWREREAEQRRDGAELRGRLAAIERERRDALAEVRVRGEELLREGRRTIENTVREIRSAEAGRPAIRSAHEQLERLADRLPEADDTEASTRTLREGDPVRVPQLGLSGRILEVRGDRVVVLAEGMRLSLPREAVEAVPTADASPAPRAESRPGGWRWRDGPPEISPEIDLRGERAEDAWQRLDWLIDRAIPAGLDRIRVVHGIGTGRLRKLLLERLTHDSRVAAVRPAGRGPGQFGATVVELAPD